MKRKEIAFLSVLIFLALLSTYNFMLAQDTTATIIPDNQRIKKVYKFDIRKDIGPPIWRRTQKAVEEAEAMNADLIIINMNTYGGMVESADSIRTKLLNTSITTIAYIDNNAASAGALIAIACDKIYMHSGSNIGAATVVDQSGQVLPDKYQSYMRSMIRSTAETNGRDPKIAEAMVDPDVEIPGIIEAGKVLTFTTSEAIKHGFCEGTAQNIEAVLAEEGITNYEMTEYKSSVLENIIGFLINPAVSGILIMVMLGGLYFELQTPGVGFPILAASVAAVLYFAPLYLEGLAANWEILLFFVGMILLGLELFVIPGFGVAGVLGIICILASLFFSLVGNVGFDFKGIPSVDIVRPLFIVVISFTASLILSVIFGKKFMSTALFSRLVLQDVQQASQGYVSGSDFFHALEGKTGVAVTTLRPSGKIELEGEVYNASAIYGYIEKGEPIIVSKYDGMNILVKKIQS
ncbi:MAG: NfeD family protein [Bacteroidia bacterium]